jgi:hypothetical protein
MSIECLVGEMPPDHKNDDIFFPELNYHQLSRYANRWVGRYASIPIERVLLYPLDTLLQKRANRALTPDDPGVVAQYGIIFQLSNHCCLDGNDKAQIDNEQTAAEINFLRQPDYLPSDCDNEFTLFMKHVEHSRTFIDHPFLDIDENFIDLVYSTPSRKGENWRSEWDFFLLHKRHYEEDEPFYLDRASSSEFWVLYTRSSETDESAPSGITETNAGPFQFETPEGTTWRSIRLVIKNNDLTEWLEVNGPEAPLGNYKPEDIGFRGHSGPGQKWTLLKQFAEMNGTIDTRGIEAIKPAVYRLRRALRELFPGIEGDPIPWRKNSWRTAFHIEASKNTDPPEDFDREVQDVFTSEVEEKSNLAKPKGPQSRQD